MLMSANWEHRLRLVHWLEGMEGILCHRYGMYGGDPVPQARGMMGAMMGGTMGGLQCHGPPSLGLVA